MGKKKKKIPGHFSKKNSAVAGASPGRFSTWVWCSILLMAVGFGVYGNTLKAPFILDDIHKISNNTDIRIDTLSQVFSRLIYPYTENKSFARNDPSRPVTFFTYTLNYHFGKLDPYGYRVVNLVGHVLVGVLLFFLTKRILFLLFGAEQIVLSFITALFFVVHPVNAIVALYPFNRSDILASLAVLGVLLLFVSPEPRSRWRYGAMIGLFIVGLGSKQSVVVLPLLLLVVDFVVVHRGRWDLFRVGVRAHVPFWAVWLIYFAARYAYFGSIGDLEAESPLEPTTYRVTQICSVLRYIQFFLFPAGLSLDHMPKLHSSLMEPAVVLSGAVLIALGALAWGVVRKGTAVSLTVLFGVLWFVIGLAPTSSFLPTTTALAENRLYLSQYGLLLLLVLGYCAVFRVDLSRTFEIKAKSLCVGIIGFHVGLFAWLAYKRGVLFNDPFKLWNEVVRVYPAQSRAYYSIGYLYYDIKQYDKAIANYEKAVECNPKYAEALNNIGMIYARQWETEKGIDYFKKSIDAIPRERSYCNLGRAYFNQKKYPEAMSALESAAAINPSSYLAYTLMGRVWYEQNEYSRALQCYERASRVYPGYYELLNNRGLLLLVEKKFDEAIDCFTRAVSAQPDYAEGFYNASVAYAQSNRPNQSQEYYEKACSIDPQYIFKPVHSGLNPMQTGVFQLPPNIEKYLHPDISSAP
jgi:tetratricopeptide (TPR) repeat protein